MFPIDWVGDISERMGKPIIKIAHDGKGFTTGEFIRRRYKNIYDMWSKMDATE